MKKLIIGGLAAIFLTSGCSSTSSTDELSTTIANTINTTAATTTGDVTSEKTFIAEVWADNWFSLYVNGELVGEDSVPITTERSFNSETISFKSTYPFTISLVAKDFKENDTGLEYIGTDRQQMGDGGLIVQIKDAVTGEIVAITNEAWKALAIHRAPLDKTCEKSSSPETECTSQIIPEPDGWMTAGFNDSTWSTAVVYGADAVGPKEGYNDITWDPTAKFIWSSDLEIDNTILFRMTVAGS